MNKGLKITEPSHYDKSDFYIYFKKFYKVFLCLNFRNKLINQWDFSRYNSKNLINYEIFGKFKKLNNFSIKKI